jgi:hypothetical protein
MGGTEAINRGMAAVSLRRAGRRESVKSASVRDWGGNSPGLLDFSFSCVSSLNAVGQNA